jgi:putative DNA primase/helicase
MIDWDGPSRQPCPDCGRGPKDKTCGVTVEHDSSGVAHCFRCGYVETVRAEGRSNRPGRAQVRAAASIRHETLSEFGQELWAACAPLAGEALAYLKNRASVIPPCDGDLRWHRALKHPVSGMVGPALVALVTDAVTGKPLTLHRTWVQANGEKAPVDPPRMLLGGHRKAGGVVRLWPDEAVTTGLGIAEGIETALSLAHAYQPAWACIDAGNLATFPVLGGIESLLIAADHDEAGISAAEQCGQRWANAGREVAIAMPPDAKADFNDLARAA